MLQTESIGNASHGLVRARGHLSQDLIQYLACLPVTHTCADVTCLRSVRGRVCHLMKILHHQTANCPRSWISFSCCSVRGGAARVSSVGLSPPDDISPSLSSPRLSLHVNPWDVPFHQRSLLGDQGTPRTRASGIALFTACVDS